MTEMERLRYVHAMVTELRDMITGEQERLLEYLLDMAASEAASMLDERRHDPNRDAA